MQSHTVYTVKLYLGNEKIPIIKLYICNKMYATLLMQFHVYNYSNVIWSLQIYTTIPLQLDVYNYTNAMRSKQLYNDTYAIRCIQLYLSNEKFKTTVNLCNKKSATKQLYTSNQM